MNVIDIILAKENPLENFELAGEDIQKEWKATLVAINEEFEKNSEEFMRDEREQAAIVAKMSTLMLG